MPYRLLLVHGEGDGLAKLAAHLDAQTHTFVHARGAQPALDDANEHPPDLILVDGALSGTSSIELITDLRRQGSTAPVVLMIPKGDEEQRVWGRRAGADEVIEKPVDPNLLVVCVRQLLRLKTAYDELDRRNRELADSAQQQRVFVESLVHDFKNPIAVVHVNIAWVADQLGADQPDLVEALGDAQEGIIRLQKMVDDLLMVGMLDQAKLPLKREYIQVAELLDGIIKSHEKEALARKVSISLSLEDDLRVVGDVAMLRRAVNNLLESSLRHTPAAGRMELSVRTGARLEIMVSNTGRPLGAEEKAQLLEKTPSSGTHRIPSGGLGLYFCRRAAEAHDGELDLVESDEWPTSLVMRLPAA